MERRRLKWECAGRAHAVETIWILANVVAVRIRGRRIQNTKAMSWRIQRQEKYPDPQRRQKNKAYMLAHIRLRLSPPDKNINIIIIASGGAESQGIWGFFAPFLNLIRILN